MSRRFWTAAALWLPVVALEMGGHAFGAQSGGPISPRISVLVQCVLASPVFFGPAAALPGLAIIPQSLAEHVQSGRSRRRRILFLQPVATFAPGRFRPESGSMALCRSISRLRP